MQSCKSCHNDLQWMISRYRYLVKHLSKHFSENSEIIVNCLLVSFLCCFDEKFTSFSDPFLVLVSWFFKAEPFKTHSLTFKVAVKLALKPDACRYKLIFFWSVDVLHSSVVSFFTSFIHLEVLHENWHTESVFVLCKESICLWRLHFVLVWTIALWLTNDEVLI